MHLFVVLTHMLWVPSYSHLPVTSVMNIFMHFWWSVEFCHNFAYFHACPSTWHVVIWYQCWWYYSFSSSCHLCHFGMFCPTHELVSCTQWQDKLPINLGHCFTLCMQEAKSYFTCWSNFAVSQPLPRLCMLHIHNCGCLQHKCPPLSAYSGAVMSLTLHFCELHLFVPLF